MSRTLLLLLAGVLLIALGLWAWLSTRRPVSDPTTADDDPRLTYASPYRNLRPEVKYVGTERCVDCHADIAASYGNHPMGRSLFPEREVAATEPLDASFHNPFTILGTSYAAERRGDQMFHKVTRPKPDGGTLFEMEAEAVYALGSGTRGRSYLVNHDGFLFQSPVSWFAQEKKWDLSPGFTATQNFDRTIQPACLFCHCNQFEPVEGTVNRYHEPLFRGHAIGCERCHGPGALHLQEAGKIDGLDPTIVNPAHLTPGLRDAVCEQCHLQGEARIVRRGRGILDYRPGMPLETFLAVFVRRPDLADRRKAVGHVEQMRASKCYQKSNGKLGCASCHDPHALPTPEQRVAFYRGRCLNCHAKPNQAPDCSLPRAERLKQNSEDSCIACHLPRNQTSDIVHTAVADHRIPRKPIPLGPAPAPGLLQEGTSPIVDFYRGSEGPRNPDADRDLGVALIELIRVRGQAARSLAQLALPLLERVAPTDVPGLEARAYALWQTGRPREARTAYEALLAQAPERETILADLAHLCSALADGDAATDFLKRVVKVNPWSARYRLFSAQLLLQRRDWSGAREQAEATLRLNPAVLEARLLLVRALQGAGETERARQEFDKALAMEPNRAEELRGWFAQPLPR
jgi:Flp pilus assembly protein TadD